MQPSKMFRHLINKRIAPKIVQFGFLLTGYSFYCTNQDNWGILDFQKSVNSTRDAIIFTVNLGVASGRLMRFFYPSRQSIKPSIWDCQWRVRLGSLIEKKDIWWTIDNVTSIEYLEQELFGYIINRGIPELQSYLSDEALRDLWLSGHSPSLTNFQRLIYLSVLLYQLGPVEYLKPTLETLHRESEGKPSAKTANVLIQKLTQSNQ